MKSNLNIGELNERITLQFVSSTSETVVDLVEVWARVKPLSGQRQLTFEQLHIGQWYEITFQYQLSVTYVSGDPIKYEGEQLTVHSIAEIGDYFYRVMAYGTETAATVDALRGTKNSLTDAGIAGQVAYDDDYAYVCVVSGTAGSATWKKFTLSLT